jgi:hypothetical protein
LERVSELKTPLLGVFYGWSDCLEVVDCFNKNNKKQWHKIFISV